MEYRNDINHDYEHDAQSGEDLGLNVVVTVERNYDAEISLSHLIIPKVEVIESHIQPSNLNQELLNEANAYRLGKQYKLSTDLNIDHQKQHWKSQEEFYKMLESFSEEECKSLVFAHNMYSRNLSANMELDKGAFKSILISIFKSQQYPIPYFRDLIQFKASNQLPNSSIEWIKNELRCALYIAYVIQGTLYNKTFVGSDELITYVLNYLKYEITHFNHSKINLPIYLNDVQTNNQTLSWRLEKTKSSYFRNCTDREIRWFKGDDSAQIEWTYNYLSSEKRDYLILQSIFIPSSLEDKYGLILASLDVLSNVSYSYDIINLGLDMSVAKIDFDSISEMSQRAKIIENMKDAWVKFSASNKNEELNGVEIYKKNQDQLDAIIKAKGASPKKVMSQIIEDEYKRIFNKE